MGTSVERLLAKFCWTLIRNDRIVRHHEVQRAWQFVAADHALTAFLRSAADHPDGFREERSRIARRWMDRVKKVPRSERAGVSRLASIADLLPLWRQWGEMILNARLMQSPSLKENGGDGGGWR